MQSKWRACASVVLEDLYMGGNSCGGVSYVDGDGTSDNRGEARGRLEACIEAGNTWKECLSPPENVHFSFWTLNAADFELQCHADVTRHAQPYPSPGEVTETTPSAMASKRKWDQAAPEVQAEGDVPLKATKIEEGKTASEAAAAAAAIAAKIAAQFSAGGSAAGSIQIGQRDPHDAEFTHDIDINDIRNRYVLTKGSTQAEVCFLRFYSWWRVALL